MNLKSALSEQSKLMYDSINFKFARLYVRTTGKIMFLLCFSIQIAYTINAASKALGHSNIDVLLVIKIKAQRSLLQYVCKINLFMLANKRVNVFLAIQYLHDIKFEFNSATVAAASFFVMNVYIPTLLPSITTYNIYV